MGPILQLRCPVLAPLLAVQGSHYGPDHGGCGISVSSEIYGGLQGSSRVRVVPARHPEDTGCHVHARDLEVHAAARPAELAAEVSKHEVLILRLLEVLQRLRCCCDGCLHPFRLAPPLQLSQQARAIKCPRHDAQGVLHGRRLGQGKVYGLRVPVACKHCVGDGTAQDLWSGPSVRQRQRRDAHGAAVGEGAALEGEVRRQAGLLDGHPGQHPLQRLLRRGRVAPEGLIVAEELCATPRRMPRVYPATLQDGGGKRQGCIRVVSVHAGPGTLLCHILVAWRPDGDTVDVLRVHRWPVLPRLPRRYIGAHVHGENEVLDGVATPPLLRQLPDLFARVALHGRAEGVADHEA
mmetsp:Transcript_31349/g.90009  ORF Transcript_31349/g.90009 Transcript_31349/m.90009 type:complete len:350 (-) Transcript_31349:108-1157(-)